MRVRSAKKILFLVFVRLITIAVALGSVSTFASAQKVTKEPPPLLLGAAWYPEQWPESRWNADLDLMQKAHMNVVRVSEFAWTLTNLTLLRLWRVFAREV